MGIELVTEQVRAKSVSIDMERTTAAGTKTRARGHVIPLKGMATAKEAEKMGREMAAELGVSEDRVRVETYKKGEAPLTANPRHRGNEGTRWSRPTKQTEVKPREFQKVRRVFGGWSPPTAEELAEFEARRKG